jgi:hypothetical protein
MHHALHTFACCACATPMDALCLLQSHVVTSYLCDTPTRPACHARTRLHNSLATPRGAHVSIVADTTRANLKHPHLNMQTTPRLQARQATNNERNTTMSGMQVSGATIHCNRMFTLTVTPSVGTRHRASWRVRNVVSCTHSICATAQCGRARQTSYVGDVV